MSGPIRLGVAPIAWTNSDLPELGGDTPLETCLRESRKAGFSGTETGAKFPMDAKVLGPILAKHRLALVSGWFSGELLKRSVKAEQARINAARARDTDLPHAFDEFEWPAIGPISGVYGSQRILNGEPRRPHFGVDVASPVGTPLKAPAGGIVSLADADLFFTGGTVMIDHGRGLCSIFAHMQTVTVREGDKLAKGDVAGTLGGTGRATGPHLHWGMYLFGTPLDPQLLADELVDAGGDLAPGVDQVSPRVVGEVDRPVVRADQQARRRVPLHHPLVEPPVGRRLPRPLRPLQPRSRRPAPARPVPSSRGSSGSRRR